MTKNHYYRDLREGDAGQVRSNCKTVHGIDIYDQKFEDHSDPVPYTYEEVRSAVFIGFIGI